MRKGRSHRKRMSRPSMSPNALSALDAPRSRGEETEQRVVSILPPPMLEIARAGEETSNDGPSSDGAVVVAQATPSPTNPDEESVPPVGDLAVVEKFFSEGDLGAHVAASAREDVSDVLDEITAEKAKAKLAPHVVRRRARFVRVVTWIAGGASALCLVAVVRTVLTPSTSPITTARAAVVTTAEPAPAPVAPAPVTPASEAPKEEEKPAAVAAVAAVAERKEEAAKQDPKAEAKVEAPTEAKPAVETAESGVAARSAAEQKASALAEKNKARSALESGRLSQAIEAGERSVAADPTDGEAWLLLGAAYQERGKLADARRCYAACIKEGKRGPKGECAAMLQ